MTSVHQPLLQALGRNLQKFRRPTVSEEIFSRGRQDVVGTLSEVRLFDLQQRFETQLLMLVEKRTTLENFQLLHPPDAQDLTTGLNTLLRHLERALNIKFRAGSARRRFPADTWESHPQRYSRLEHIIALLDESKETVDLTGNHNLALFKIDNLEDVRNAHASVALVNGILQRSQSTASVQATPTIEKASRSHEAFTKWVEFFGSVSNERVKNLLDTIAKDFDDCESLTCHTAHAIRTQLLNYDVKGQMPQEYLAFCLYCPNTGDWQLARCEFETQLQERPTHRSRLCEHLKTSQSLAENLNLLFHENSKFFSPNTASLDVWNGSASTSLKDLIETDHSFGLPVIGERFRFEERRALVAKLILHLLIFCPWKHTSIPWDGNSIHFLRSEVGNVEKSSPFIVWQLGSDSSKTLKNDDVKDPKATKESSTEYLAKSFASFARLLLEIEYGNMSNTGYPLDDRSIRQSLQKYLEELRKTADPITHGKYLHAVDACLKFHRAFENARMYQVMSQRVGLPESPEDTYRRLVRNDIASNILIDLLDLGAPAARQIVDEAIGDGFYDSFDESDFDFVDDEIPQYPDSIAPTSVSSIGQYFTSLSQSIKPSQWNRWIPPLDSHSTHTHPEAQVFSTSTVRDSLNPLENGRSHISHNRQTRAPAATYGGPRDIRYASPKHESLTVKSEKMETVIRNLLEPDTGYLLSETNEPNTLKTRQSGCDKWFNNFVDLLQLLELDVDDEDDDKAQALNEPLRIAILDSGINFNDREFNNGERDRIKGRKSFIGGTPDTDTVGHGTHIVATILRLTVNVELFIAKITDSKGAAKAPVVEAINHAREKWHVNMISLSCGFEHVDRRDGLQDAIEACIKDSILVFASASNDGGEGARTYPANWPDVMCVHASMYWGEKYRFNPTPQGNWNLSTVGVDLRPVWGRSDIKKSTKMLYESGTSYATPVAVSIAAFMIEFIRQQKWARNLQWMYPPDTPRGMEYIMKLMAKKVDGYDWVSPTRYFKYTPMYEIEANLRTVLVRGNLTLIQ